jgi:HPt (histidine-containing phosphotransfer) domain-containing protein
MTENLSFIEDLDGVLARLAGNKELMVRLLDKFRVNYHDSRDEFLGFLASSRTEDAYRLVHSIKGVSANLGIGRLYRFSVALENRMREGRYDSMQAETEPFLAELDRVIAELDNLHGD